MSNSSIMSVREMIDNAFGDPRKNTVDHKLIQAILFLLARQLRMLERRVEVEIGPLPYDVGSETSLSVTELKIHAMQKKKKPVPKHAAEPGDARPSIDSKQGTIKGRAVGIGEERERGTTGKPGARFTSPEEVSLESAAITTTEGKSTLDKTTWSSTDKTSSEKTTSEPLTSTDKTTSSRLTSTDKTTTSTSDKTTTENATDLSSTDKTTTTTDFSTTDKTTTTTDMSTTEFSSTDKNTTSTTGKTTSSDQPSTGLSTTEKTTTATTDKTSTGLSTTDKTATSSTDKNTTGISSSDKQPTSTSGISSTDKQGTTTTGMSSSDKQPTSTSGISSSDKRTTTSEKISSDKTSTEKSLSGKTSNDKTLTDKTSTDKTTTEKTSTDKTSSGKTSTEKTTTDKTSTDKALPEKSSSDKSSTEKFTTEESSSIDKLPGDKMYGRLSTDKASTNKSLTHKTSFGKPTTVMASTEKISADKFMKPITGKRTIKKDDTRWSEKADSPSTTSTERTSTDRSSTDRTSTDLITTEKKISKDKTSSLKRPMTDAGGGAKRKPKDYQTLLETIEERRERELRVIHQRADSFEESGRTPTPIASLDSVEAKYEKLLIVERVPSKEAQSRAAGRGQGRTAQLSVVTQEQFRALAEEVRKLQERFFPSGFASFPENAQLMEELRKGASLTDAMAALQLSARLEAAEKTLTHMLSIVTDIARQTPGVDLSAPPAETRIIFGPAGFVPKNSAVAGAGAGVRQGSPDKSESTAKGQTAKEGKGTKNPPSDRTPPSMATLSIEMTLPQSMTLQEEEVVEGPDGVKVKPDRITYEELDNAMQELQDEIIKKVTSITSRSINNADNALKIAARLDGKLNQSLKLNDRMADLETLIADYAEQINALDTGLSSQMTNYQEQLTQMQHDLEVGLETMAEVLANTGGDTAAVAELNAHFTNFQLEFDNMAHRQKDLKMTQTSLSSDLKALWKQIEILRETKSDREEVADALRDKAGIGALNGLMSLQQFEAVRGDFEKRIAAAYDKFNNQEIIWQKAIDELLRELSDKAELIQVMSLKDEIDKHLNLLKSRLNAMMEIVGEPRAAALTRKLHRDTACLSCSTPAHMDLEEPGKVAALPAFQARQPGSGQARGQGTGGGRSKARTKGDGDHGLCYPGHPVLHPVDPRAHVCQRYCGGSHTIISNTNPRVPPSFNINTIARPTATEPGTDGKMYMVDQQSRKPCLPCNTSKAAIPQVSLEPLDPNPTRGDDGSDIMTPPDFGAMSQLMNQAAEIEPSSSVSTTPPPPIEDN